MLPSIKESDRYAFTDRIHLALSDLALTILGAASSAALLQHTLFYSHTAAVVLPPLLFAGCSYFLLLVEHVVVLVVAIATNIADTLHGGLVLICDWDRIYK
mmetsp:Transcript_29963/g.44302  ORF Transcript_29963/g.44302 Transcript_29963/m.44302 type:complete len:101 (+) Transcript_29963:112-414(+)